MNSLMGVISTGFAQTQRGGGMGMRPGRFATSGQSPLGPSRGTLVLHSTFCILHSPFGGEGACGRAEKLKLGKQSTLRSLATEDGKAGIPRLRARQ
jgi:hypothetical protein